MMQLLLLAGLLASSAAIVAIVVWTSRHRSRLHFHSSADQLGSVSQHWLTTHRAER